LVHKRCRDPDGSEQLQRVSRDTLHERRCEGGNEGRSLSRGQPESLFARFLKIGAVLNQGGAVGCHRGVLFGAVAMRHDDGDRDPNAAPGKCQGLTMIAAGR